jgi:Phosphodiester glycosidase
VSSPVTVAGVGEDRIARLASLALEGTVTIGGRARQLDAFNSTIGDNRLGAYTPQWGPGRRTFFAGAGSIEVLVTDGRVAEVRPQATAQPVPDGGLVLVGRGAAAQWLAQAQVDEPVNLTYAAKTNAASPFGFALGGGGVLVRDGVVLPQSDNTDKPRTAIGWRDRGRTLLLLAVDGGQAYSRGATFQEVADLLGRAGAEDAMMLDGGGSTTMVARTPGDAAVSVTNAPSDGGERLVPNGVGLVPPRGSGRLAGFDVRPGATRVFPGLTREYDAAGYDEMFAPRARRPELAGGARDAGPLRRRRLPRRPIRQRRRVREGARDPLAGGPDGARRPRRARVRQAQRLAAARRGGARAPHR